VTDAFQANAPWVTGFLTLSHEDALRDALTGLRDLVVALDPALAHAVDDAGADVLARLGEIDRFDAAIGSEDGHARVKAAIDALGAQTGLIVATRLGVQLDLEG
jgi:uncharacterized iron-regulated protein